MIKKPFKVSPRFLCNPPPKPPFWAFLTIQSSPWPAACGFFSSVWRSPAKPSLCRPNPLHRSGRQRPDRPQQPVLPPLRCHRHHRHHLQQHPRGRHLLYHRRWRCWFRLPGLRRSVYHHHHPPGPRPLPPTPIFDEFTPAILGNISFVPTCNLTDQTPGGGAVSLNPPGGVYGSNTVVTLTANPAPGWTFANWTGGPAAPTPSPPSPLPTTSPSPPSLSPPWTWRPAPPTTVRWWPARPAASIRTEPSWTFRPCPLRGNTSSVGQRRLGRHQPPHHCRHQQRPQLLRPLRNPRRHQCLPRPGCQRFRCRPGRPGRRRLPRRDHRHRHRHPPARRSLPRSTAAPPAPPTR